MKQTRTANIAGINFYLDEGAYQTLDNYLKELRKHFKNQEGAAEIISDIENRIAELFQQKLKTPQTVITLEEVNEIIAILGKPGDFDNEDSEESTTTGKKHKTKRLYRDMDDRILGGVCSGLGAYLNLDQVIVRIIFIVATLSGISILVYLAMWIIIPPALTTAEKLEMHGDPVNIDNIEKTIRKEMDHLKDKLNDLSEKAKNTFKRKN
jgi:phage shock protein PspC (stress-responsive transcriptional regulator)